MKNFHRKLCPGEVHKAFMQLSRQLPAATLKSLKGLGILSSGLEAAST